MTVSYLGRLGAVFALALGLTASSVAAAATRTVDTAYGPVSVDGEPQRVVTLYEGALDTVIASGITPVAAIATRGGTGVASYLQARAENVAIVGTAREINLEAVAAQKPDLILASPTLSREQYALLASVAPTVVPKTAERRADNWKLEARLFARALGREAPIEQALEQVEAEAARLAEQVHTRYSDDDRTAYLARWMPQGALVMSAQLFSSGLLRAAGFDAQDGGLAKGRRPHSDPLSLENLARVDGDWLFLATLNEDGRAALAAAEQSPAFARLDVVRRGRVVPVDGQLWTSASGPLAAAAILADIEAVLSR